MTQPERVSPKHENVMDVTVEQLARVYAKAFMGVAAKTSNTEALIEGATFFALIVCMLFNS